MKKRILSLILITALCFPLAACAEDSGADTETDVTEKLTETDGTIAPDTDADTTAPDTDHETEAETTEEITTELPETEPVETEPPAPEYVHDPSVPDIPENATPGLEYALTDLGFTVIGIGTAKDRNIVIPSYHENVPVTTIGGSAFENKNIKSVTVPETVSIIEWGAFKGCTELTTVTLADGVKILGGESFESCTALKTIYLPDSIESIDISVFKNCEKLSDVVLPKSLTIINSSVFFNCTSITEIELHEGITYISHNAFHGSGIREIHIPSTATKEIYGLPENLFENCRSLEKITVAEGNTAFYAVDNCLIRKEDKTLITVCKGSVIPKTGEIAAIGSYAFAYTDFDEIVIPEGVEVIRSGAFYRSEAEKIILPKTLKKLEAEAFKDAVWLKSIEIPESVTEYGESLFYGCTSLKSAVLPDNITSLPWKTFYNCENLRSVNIPKNLKTLPYATFYGCKKLSFVELPEGLVTLETAFIKSGIKEIHIPKSTVSIYSGPFADCDSLEKITVDENNPSYFSSGNCIIGRDIGELVAGCKNSVIPNDGTVRSIGQGAFAGIDGLKKITIPESVEVLYYSAFHGCTALKELYIPKSVTLITVDSTANVTAKITISDENPRYAIIDGCLIEKETKTLIFASADFKIPSDGSVKELGAHAFSYLDMTELIIPEGVETIGVYAFLQCGKLESLTLPSTLKYIDPSAVGACYELKTVKYNGTAEKWSNIDGSTLHESDRGSFTLICTDKTVEVEANHIGGKCY